MNTIFKLIFFLGALSLPIGQLSAHQPDLSSTILAQKGPNEWVVQVRAALTAFEYEIEQHYGPDAYASPEEFRSLVIAHFSEGLSVSFNDGVIATLEEGIVKLGHETTLTFQLNGVSETVKSVQITNSGFSRVSRSQSALYVAKEGFERDQYWLRSDNNYSASLRADDTHFVLVTPSTSAGDYVLPFLFLISILSASIYFYLKYSKKQLATA